MNPSLFLEPLDVLFLRSNKLFGDAGSFGESLMPPWPSVVAGAIRSRILIDAGYDVAAFARGEVPHPELGTPAQPGTFTVTAFHLARRRPDGSVEMLVAPPEDLVISMSDQGEIQVRALTPRAVANAIVSSSPFELLPILAQNTRSKPVSGYWLNEEGWRAYLAGNLPSPSQLVPVNELWTIDTRVGVGLNADRRSAADGRLFTVQAVSVRPNVGFLVAVRGANLPTSETIRLGGDGRAAAVSSLNKADVEPDYVAIVESRRCRLILSTPGVFARGWLPTGASDASGYRFELHGVRARLVCAAVARPDVVSGWDLARWQPKPAVRVAPVGSVYWLDQLEATPEGLRNLIERGLWEDPCENAARRAEGFNRVMLAPWMGEPSR